MASLQPCIFCGVRPGDTQDHIPPRGFFQRKCPNDAQLLTVPCCEPCRSSDQQTDTFVRDVLAGLLEAEAHPYVHEHVTDRVSRSIQRGGKNLHRLIEILKAKETIVLTPDGPQLATLPALNLDAPEFDRFFDRVGRAVLFDAYSQGFFCADSDWIAKVQMPAEYFAFMVKNAPCRSILDVFAYYATPVINGNRRYVLVQFHQSLSFMVRFKIGEAEQAPRRVP